MSKSPKCRFCGAVEENHNERGCWPERQVRQSRTPEWRVEDIVPKEIPAAPDVPIGKYPLVPIGNEVVIKSLDKSQLDKSQELDKSHGGARGGSGRQKQSVCGLPDHDERGSRYCKHCREAKKKAGKLIMFIM